MRRVRICEAVFDAMEARGLNDEDQEFEDMLYAIADLAASRGDWSDPDNDLLMDAVFRKVGENWAEIFMTWKFWLLAHKIDNMAEFFSEMIEEGRKAIENRVPLGEGAGSPVGAAYGAESASDEDLPCDGLEGRGCSELEAGAVEAELLDYRTEDEEAATDWLAGAIAFGLESERWNELGVSGEEPGEAPDETGRVEGRKTCFGSLPPLSERRTSLYAKGVLR